MWNVAQRIEVARFDSGDGQVWSHWFDPAGGSVYSYGSDGLHQWDLSGSQTVIRTDDGTPISFRIAGHLLTMTDESVSSWIEEACRLAGRSLTAQEWSTHLGAAEYDPVC